MALNQYVNTTVYTLARKLFSKATAKLAISETYGLNRCDEDWNSIIGKYLVINMLDCTGGAELAEKETECVVGFVAQDLIQGCCGANCC